MSFFINYFRPYLSFQCETCVFPNTLKNPVEVICCQGILKGHASYSNKEKDVRTRYKSVWCRWPGLCQLRVFAVSLLENSLLLDEWGGSALSCLCCLN
jgi:hypothetical protein